jgi:hypothetical protein
MEKEKNIQELIKDFIIASKTHYDASKIGDWKTANKQAKVIHKVFQKIKKYGNTAQDELLKLVDNDDDSVACMAAAYSLPYNEIRSKNTLQRISKKEGLIGFIAEQGLERWQKKPLEIE